MSWLYKKDNRHSAQNGRIIVAELFGSYEVRVGDSVQTSGFTASMFADAFKKIKNLGSGDMRRALMLGLGGGSAIAPLHKAFPHCTLVAVEYDAQMIEIAKELGLYKPFPFPEVLCVDANDALKNITEQFDLIIVDLFKEREPSPLLRDVDFLHSLQKKLTPHGIVLVNASGKPEYLELLQKTFTRGETWKFWKNNLGAFWNRGK